MNQKSLIAFLIVVIIILTGTSVYFATNSSAPTELPEEAIEEVVEEIETEEDEIEVVVTEPANDSDETGVKTYSNSDVGFSVDYPSEWPVLEADCSNPDVQCAFTFGDLPSGPGDREGRTNYVFVAIRSSEISDGIEEFMVETEDCTNYFYETFPMGLRAGSKTCHAMDGFLEHRFAFENNGSLYTVGTFTEPDERPIDEYERILLSFAFID